MKIANLKIAALGAAIATGLVLSPMAPVFAGQKTDIDPVITASAATKWTKVLATQMSKQGYQAMQAISGARLAIFNGKPALAKKLVASAA